MLKVKMVHLVLIKAPHKIELWPKVGFGNSDALIFHLYGAIEVVEPYGGRKTSKHGQVLGKGVGLCKIVKVVGDGDSKVACKPRLLLEDAFAAGEKSFLLGEVDALLKDGKLIYLMERHQIENQEAGAIAEQLTSAFDKHCAAEAVAG